MRGVEIIGVCLTRTGEKKKKENGEESPIQRRKKGRKRRGTLYFSHWKTIKSPSSSTMALKNLHGEESEERRGKTRKKSRQINPKSGDKKNPEKKEVWKILSVGEKGTQSACFKKHLARSNAQEKQKG